MRHIFIDDCFKLLVLFAIALSWIFCVVVVVQDFLAPLPPLLHLLRLLMEWGGVSRWLLCGTIYPYQFLRYQFVNSQIPLYQRQEALCCHAKPAEPREQPLQSVGSQGLIEHVEWQGSYPTNSTS